MLAQTSNETPSPELETDAPVRVVPPIQRAFLIALGGLCLGVGAIGVVVPGLPTTVFVLAAVFLFARSHPPLERWVRQHRIFGPYLSLGQRGMPRRARVTAITLMWVAISFSVAALWSRGPLWPSVIVGLGLVGTSYLVFGLRARATDGEN